MNEPLSPPEDRLAQQDAMSPSYVPSKSEQMGCPPPVPAFSHMEGGPEPIVEEVNRESHTDEREELVTIIVEIGDGREESIVAYAGDRAEDLAARFAARHGLDARMREKLAANIQQNIEQALMDIGLEDEAKRDLEVPEASKENFASSNVPVEPEKKPSGLSMRERINNIVGSSRTKHSAGPSQSEKDFLRWQDEIERNMRESSGTDPAPRIDKNSQRIASGIPLTGLPVYERLHMQAVNKQRADRGRQRTMEASSCMENG